MAISHSNHLFVPVVFVFFLLSPLVQAEDSNQDYTDSRQLEKNHAVSRQRNNIQRLPNYNWKPPKHYGLRKESTEKKAGMEFTKPEDPEQRVADPWIKKMQEISRQKGEKWVPYKKNENGKLAPDNVEESTKANKLTNDESIMQVDPTILMTLAQLSVDQDNASKKDLHNSSLLQSTDANTNGPFNKKFKDRRNIGIENSSAEFLLAAPVVETHQRYKDYEISDIKKDLFDKQNATVADYERSELEEDRSLSSKVNSHSEESISQKTQHRPNNTRRNNEKYLNSDENLNYKNNSEESPAKEHPRQSNLSRSDNKKGGKDGKRRDEKIVTTKPLTRKSKEERDNAGMKETTGGPLNHGESFHPGRWGMSILSPPMGFLKDISRRSMHRKNKDHIEGEKDGGDDLVGRWDSSPPKEFLQDTLMHRAVSGTGHSTVKTGPRPSQVEESSNRRSLAQNSQADPTQRLIIDERNKELAEILYEKLANDLYASRYPRLNYWNNYRTNVDLLNNHPFPRNVKFLMQALQSYIEQNDIPDILMFCRIQIPYAPFRI